MVNFPMYLRAPLSILIGAASLACAPAQAENTYISATKWPGGRLVWYYNPTHTPAGMSHDYVVESIKESFDSWAQGCRIQPEYGGTTTVPADPNHFVGTHQVTIGFFPFGEMAAGRGGLVDDSGAGHATAGIVALNTSSPALEVEGDGRWVVPGIPFKQVLSHEIGHLLGLGHTAFPYSLMYNLTTAGPNSWKTEPFAEDYTTCANLYGSNGVVARPYYGGDFQANPALGVSVAMQTSMPNDATPASPQEQFDLSTLTSIYKSIKAPRGMPGDLQWRLVLPNGDLVDPVHYSLEPENKAMIRRFGSFWMSSTLPLEMNNAAPFLPSVDGRWRLQALLDGSPAAEHVFHTVNGRQPVNANMVEFALLVEPSGDGYAVRKTEFGGARLLEYSAYLNSDYSKDVREFGATAKPSIVELWGRSDQPRVSSCIPVDTPDIARSLHFLSNNGAMADKRIDVAVSGTLASLSASVEIETSATGEQSVFVVREDSVNGLLYRHPDGSWNAREMPLFTFRTPGAATLDVLRNLNVHELPANATLRVAFGNSYAQALAAEQVALVHTTVPPSQPDEDTVSVSGGM